MRVFLSAVSSQFKECREALRSDLAAKGCEVKVQEDFRQGPRSLLEWLEEQVAACDCVIALVGNAYGAEAVGAPARARTLPRSYTQWEYCFASGERLDGTTAAIKDLYVYVASDDFVRDHPVAQSDEDASKQAAFVTGIKASGKHRGAFGTRDGLRAQVLRDLPSNDRPALPTNGHPPGFTDVVVERVECFEDDRTKIINALALWEERIPAEERFEHDQMVDLISGHLSGRFGPTWKLHFLTATLADRTVGMLAVYEDVASNYAFVSYMAVRNPRLPGMARHHVGEKLIQKLLKARERLGLRSPRLIFEIDSPALAESPKEARRRLGRLKLFSTLAPYEGLHLRAFDVRYFQPRLDWPGTVPERELLLCYAAPGLATTMPKAEVVEILTWTYTQLYGDDIFEDPSTRAAYAKHTRELLAATVNGLPEHVRLLRYSDLDRRRRESES